MKHTEEAGIFLIVYLISVWVMKNGSKWFIIAFKHTLSLPIFESYMLFH